MARSTDNLAANLPFASARSRAQAAGLGFVVLWIAASALAWGGSLLADEWVHFLQIDRFRLGDTRVFEEYLTTIPGYHWFLALLMRAFQAESLGAARLINSVLGLGAIYAFYRLRQAIGGEDAATAALQFACFPILFPFFFLVYTDVASLGLVLGAAVLSIHRHHRVAAVTLVAAMCVRQTNVLWILFVAWLGAWPVLAPGTSARRRAAAALRLLWPYGAAGAVFVGYWVWHGSISWSTAQAANHPDFKLSVGNIYFMLFLGAILLPLHAGAGLVRFARAVRRAPLLLLLPAAAMALFWFAFRVDHPFNFIEPAFILRNRVLVWVHDSTPARVAFGAVATLAGCGLAMVPMLRREAIVLYPLALAFVGSSWLIEQRYTLIPFAFWLALRAPLAEWIERSTTLFWAALAAVLCWGTFDFRFFL